MKKVYEVMLILSLLLSIFCRFTAMATVIYQGDEYMITEIFISDTFPIFYPEADLYKVSKDGKYGFIDLSGNTIIPLIYDDTDTRFSEGLAWFKKDGKYGYIDIVGTVVVPFIYEGASWFYYDGYANVKQGDKEGLIDKAGNVVIPFIYDHVESFYNGVARARKDGKEGFIDKAGNVVVPFMYDLIQTYYDRGFIAVKKDEKWGVIDNAGNVLIPIIYEQINIGIGFVEGLIPACKDGKWGYIDNTGNIVLPFKYNSPVVHFEEGLHIEREGDFREGGKLGAIDKFGNVVIPYIYDSLSEFSEELAAASVVYGYDSMGFSLSKYGFIDKSGNVVISLNYDYVHGFQEGLACVIKDGKYGYVDKAGNIVVLFNYDDARDFREGLAEVKKDGKWGYIDKGGSVVIPFIYDDVNNFYGGFACIGQDGKYGLIDKFGNVIIPLNWDMNAIGFHGDFFSFGEDGKFGFADQSGKIVIPMTYNFINLNDKYPRDSVLAGVDDKFCILKKTAAPTAIPTSSAVLVNGKNIAFDAYSINDNNYFKLRDLAYALNGTEKQFEVGYDGEKNVITITGGYLYTSVGGEMKSKGSGEKAPILTKSKILLDGNEMNFTAYNIDGNNYFKLRDIGQALDFYVGWDEANNTIVIDTSKGYVNGEQGGF